MKMLRDEALEDARVPENFKAAISRAQWAMTSLNASRLRSMVSLAETREQIRVDSTDLDPRPTKKLLNVNNGTVNLKTGELMPHNPNMYITKMIPIDYDPEAECPFWMRTLELAFDGDKELIDYMQRAIGYSITGSTAEQCLFICWGEQGNNGKSTILETIQRLFGDYAQMSDMKVITSSQMDNRVASSLAKLPGVRLVSMNEAEENQKFSESLIKQITGGDTLQACKKFKEPFEFQPVFKLWIRTNEKPIIRGMNDAIWRRIRLIPFEKPIPAEHRLSRDIVDVRLDKEAEGILNWCIQGAKRWYDGGLDDPDIVTAATQGYRTEMDIIEIFFDECVNDDVNGYVPRSELYQTFTRWAKENGLRYIMTSVAFGKRVGRKLNSPPREKIRGQYVWKGITLTEFAQMSFTV
jgi:putative DNA primase/helicase